MPIRVLLLLAAMQGAAAAAAETTATTATTALAAPAVDCGAVLAGSRGEQVSVPDWQAGRRVAGKQRLYFHSAPARACRLRNVFVVPGDVLAARHEYATFTEVVYVHPKTGSQSTGWVETGRLLETMAGRAAGR